MNRVIVIQLEHDMVDEYRLLVFPTVLGAGRRLFTSSAGAGDLGQVSVEQSGPAVLVCYRRAGR
jgi:riboflavin biosynthesis pyrimidine reductase